MSEGEDTGGGRVSPSWLRCGHELVGDTKWEAQIHLALWVS